MTPLQLSIALTHKNSWAITHMETPVSKNGYGFHIEAGKASGEVSYILTIRGTAETVSFQPDTTSLAYDFSLFGIELRNLYSINGEKVSDSIVNDSLSESELMAIIENPQQNIGA